MDYNVLADIVVAIHFAFLAFVIVGQLFIVVGAVCGWQWIRNPWFRWIHFLAIAYVIYNTVRDVSCPLTVLEDHLRVLGERPHKDQISFIGRFLQRIIFYEDIPDDHWGFKVAYVSFGLMVLAAFILAPPRGCGWLCPWKRGPEDTGRPDTKIPSQATGHADGQDTGAGLPDDRIRSLPSASRDR